MIVKEVLPNGLTLITESIPHVRSVAVGVWLKQGSRHETPQETGISHFIEHMVFKGTRTRPVEVIAAQVDSIGGHMDAFTTKEYAAFHLKVLDEHLALAVDILGDIVTNPLFDKTELEKEKKVIFEEMGMVEDTPDDLVSEMFTQSFWPSHPLGRPILGTRKSVGGFTRRELLAFFKSVYRPANIVVAAAGHLEHQKASALIHHHLGELEAGGRKKTATAPAAAARIVTRSKKELEQIHLCLGVPAFEQGHDDRFAALILNTVLGGSMSSRLFQHVREKRGLVYSISSGLTAYSDAGMLSVYAGTSLDEVDEVIDLVLLEFRILRDQALPDDELRRAKDHLKGSLMLSLENTGSRMSHLARQEIYFERRFSLDETIASIEAVTAQDVQRVAGVLFRDRVAASVLGNLGRYRPKAAQLRI